MDNRENSNNPNTGHNEDFSTVNANRPISDDLATTPLDITFPVDTTPLDTTSLDSIPLNNVNPQAHKTTSDTTLPYEDPAITNPEELASFPKPAPIADAEDVENESESRLVNRRSPVREGRNIARTDNAPNEEGYI